ncbi:MAG: hypothetical protein HQL58_06040 [Magnetococcales bacterium]|nr:hypothetical protein [Magnetococcales bacterium]
MEWINRFPFWHTIISRLRRTSQGAGLACIAAYEEGFAVTHVLHRGDAEKPLVDVCSFVVDSGSKNLNALARFINSSSLATVHFAGLMFPTSYMLFPAEAPQVPEAEVNNAIRWRIKDRLDFPIQEAVVDVFNIPGSRMATGDQQMVYVVAAREMMVRSCAEPFQRLKLDLQRIDILELALLNLMALTEDDADGMGLLFLDRSSGVVLAGRNGQMFIARPIDYGLNQLLESVNGRADVSANELGNSFVLDAIALEVQRTLDYYESHFSQPPAVALHVVPMPVPITGLLEALGDKLGMRVRNFAVRDLFEFAVTVDDADVARCLPAIGAALYRGGVA